MSEFRQFCIAVIVSVAFFGTLQYFEMLRPIGPPAGALLATSFFCGCGWVAFHGKRGA